VRRLDALRRKICRWCEKPHLRRGVVLWLLFAFAVSAISHACWESRAASAAAHFHGPAAPSLDLAMTTETDGSEPLGAPHRVPTHGATCVMADGCPFCAPLAISSVVAVPKAAPVEPETIVAGLGIVLPAHFRPPKLLSNV
jgi:hypothetical protein